MTLAFPTTAQRLNTAANDILKSSKDKLEWKAVDVETFPANLAQAYLQYKDAQRIAAALRQEFEDMACGPIGQLLGIKQGQDVAFGYKFGQLSVAIAPKREPRAKANALRF